METRAYPSKRKSLAWSLTAGIMIFVVQAGVVPKEAGAVMFGTYTSAGDESQGTSNPFGTGYLNNGQVSSTSTVGPSPTSGDYATATASLSNPNSLSVILNGNGITATNVVGGNTYGSAHGSAMMLDTLTFGNLPSGTVSGTLADLTMSLASNIYNAGGNVYGGADLSVFAPTVYMVGYIPVSGYACPSSDCPNVNSGNYNYQWTNLASNGISIGSPGAVFTIPITSGDLSNGKFSYIADIWANVFGPYTPYSEPFLFIDPSISLTNLAPGITVTSASGANYLGASPPISETPEASSLVLFATGLVTLGGWARIKKNGKPGASHGKRCFSS